MALKKTGSYKGKSNKVGGGGRFAQTVDAIMRAGIMDRKEAAAIAAKQGRKKYGKTRFAKMGAAGRKRKKKAA